MIVLVDLEMVHIIRDQFKYSAVIRLVLIEIMMVGGVNNNKMKFLIYTIALVFILTACIPKQVDLVLDNNTESEVEIRKEGGPTAEEAPHPISIDAFIQKDFNGSDFTVGNVLADNSAYTRYYITYKSGDLTISGIMNVPKGAGPFPVLFLNHGYIDPAIYTNGRGLKREQDYLARQGYVVIHSDYRNHAQSDKDPNVEQWFRLKYAEDIINAIDAIKKTNLSYMDTTRIGMLGHSMGGGVTMNVLAIRPELVDAAVLFAPVSADYRLNYDKWTKQRFEVAAEIEEAHGTPEENPEFWDGISVKNYFDRVIAPIMNHHGTKDESVPLWWSDDLKIWLDEAGLENTYYVYEDEKHEFINQWPLVMRRTTEFFDKVLK